MKYLLLLFVIVSCPFVKTVKAQTFYQGEWLNLEKPITPDTVFIIPDFYFERRERAFSEDGQRILDIVVSLMKENPNLFLEVGSHMSPIYGQMCSSLETSVTREVKRYLMDHGVSSDRWITRLYADGVPFEVQEDSRFFKKGTVLNAYFYLNLPNDTLKWEADRLNDRTEIKILKENPIKKLTK